MFAISKTSNDIHLQSRRSTMTATQFTTLKTDREAKSRPTRSISDSAKNGPSTRLSNGANGGIRIQTAKAERLDLYKVMPKRLNDIKSTNNSTPKKAATLNGLLRP